MQIAITSTSVPYQEISVESIVHLAASHGYAGIEWHIREGGPINWEDPIASGMRCAQLTREAGLRSVGLLSYVSPFQVARLPRLLDAAEAAACPQIRLWLPGEVPNIGNTTALADAIARWSEAASDRGLRIVIETHYGTRVADPYQFREIQKVAPTVGAIYDPTNMVMEGWISPLRVIETLRSALVDIHVKDVRTRGQHWCWAPIGRGIVPWHMVLTALVRYYPTYAGCLTIECFLPQPAAVRFQEVNALRSVLDRVRRFVVIAREEDEEPYVIAAQLSQIPSTERGMRRALDRVRTSAEGRPRWSPLNYAHCPVIPPVEI